MHGYTFESILAGIKIRYATPYNWNLSPQLRNVVQNLIPLSLMTLSWNTVPLSCIFKFLGFGASLIVGDVPNCIFVNF